MMTSIDDLGRWLARLERNQLEMSTPQLSHSSIENGALRAHDDELGETMQIGLQWDGTYAPTVTAGPIPPTPIGLIVADATEAIIVSWGGLFADGAVAPMDFLRVDVHIGATSDFLPTYANRRATFASPTGGTTGIHLPFGTYWVKLVCWTLAGKVSLASEAEEGDSWPVEVSSDGFPPASSPNPEIFQGIREMYVRWPAMANPDPVWYDVHISTTLGFTPDSTTLVGSTRATAYTIDALPGPPPAEGAVDPRVLDYDAVYYVRIVARDDDGAAPPSLQAVGGIFRATGLNLAVDSVAAQHIAVGSLVGEHFSATVIFAGTFKTADAGQRVETGIAGIQGYKADGTLMINFPTDPGQTALIDAEIIARGLTVTNGMTLRATSRVEADAVIELGQGLAAPISAPQPRDDWMERRPDTSSLTAAEKTGDLGTFDLIPSEVSCIEWKSGSNTWIVHQIRPGGTRAWFFDYDGGPVAWSGGAYFADYVNWEIWSVVEITTSTPAKNGVYRMSRWIPSPDTYYLQCPQGGGFNRYSRQNGAAPPVVGTNGTDVYVAEVIGTQLNIRYFTPNGDGNNLPAPFTVYQSAAGFVANVPLSTVQYHAGAFDTGSPSGRYLTASRGFGYNNRLVYTSGTNAGSIHPGGVAAGPSSWSSPNKEAESFEAAHVNPRCITWMPGDNRFWTYCGDGYLRQHTNQFWDPAVTSSTLWLQHTFYDSVGTVHETTGGPVKSFNWKRRSRIALSLPPLPGAGGVDEPNVVVTYAGRGATQPANSAMFWQTAQYPTGLIDTLATSGANPPTVSTFPNTNPGKVTSENGVLVISGDGTIKIGGKDVALGQPTVQRFTSAGTWSKPSGAKLVRVQVKGGGGAGGGATTSAAGQHSAGSGGGAGGYSEKWFLASDLAASVPVSVGGGGVPASGTTGGGGGASSFQHTTSVVGNGGGGGLTAGALATAYGPQPGSGGTATGGDTNIPGGGGGPGWGDGIYAIGGQGGNGMMGFGGAGRGTAQSGVALAGLAGGLYGGGGGGGITCGAVSAVAGGAGAAGIVIVTCYF